MDAQRAPPCLPVRPTWIFDLDNTLHDADPHIFPHLNRSMTAYLESYLGLEREEANSVRMLYSRRYGATLLGLIRHHAVDPGHFLRETHRFPELHRMVLQHPLLRSVLTRLPGRKLVFSNSPVHYSLAVLGILRVADLFDDVFSIEHTGYRPKPDRRGFLSLLRKHRLRPGRCVMVEDSLANLKTAKRLGMRTVWVGAAAKAPAHVDVSIRHVTHLPRMLGRLHVS
ncbi:MAG TPA: pyrimidine 5'-nucleotidase [Burkholderiales bacterium]|nr:pyrimidine 5'-nucleotidase [Burkholderiales bacterium]